MAGCGGAVSGKVTVVPDFKRTHFYSRQLRSPLYRMLARYLECLTGGKPLAGAQDDDCPQ
jgi:hypothetical protein